MQLYLYSCQDLIVGSSSFNKLKADNFYNLQLDKDELINIYSTTSAGVMMLNYNILVEGKHNQITFHKLNDDAMLCEVKPFVLSENARQYVVKGGSVRLIDNVDATYIYCNGTYYGCIKQRCSVKFEKNEKNGQEYGVLCLLGDKKYLILFNTQIIFCGQYVDNEILKDCIQIYTHIPNMFNVGNLVKYDFNVNQLSTRVVSDRGEERKQISGEFNIIYFLEAIKCGRYKSAYNKLSYELRSEINIEVLSKYFNPFDNYHYLSNEDAYITLKNNKVAGVYHFGVKDNMIDNIY